MKKQHAPHIQRESVGIAAVDAMIDGGVPQESIIGLLGPPGVGKSIFALHFLLEGARTKQKSVYINLEEPEANIIRMVSLFDFSDEFMSFVKKGLIVIRCFTYPEYERVHQELFMKIKEDTSIKRVVIDSFNSFFDMSFGPQAVSREDSVSLRRMVNESFSMLRRHGLTSLLSLEAHAQMNMITHNMSFLLDGTINLDFLELGTIERRIFIPKMRWTNQYKESKTFEINRHGIQVLE